MPRFRPTLVLLLLLSLPLATPVPRAALAQDDAGAHDVTPHLTPAEWVEDLHVLAERLPEVHRDAFHSISPERFASEVSDLERRIPDLSDSRVIVELARIVASIGDGHTRLWLSDHGRNGFRRYPIALYGFKDGLYLVAADRAHAEAVGGRVVRIGDVDVEEALRRVEPLVHRDNEMGLQRIGPLYLRIPEVLDALGIVDDMKRARFVVEKDGREIEFVARPVPGRDLSDNALINLPVDPSAYGSPDFVTMRRPEAPVPVYLRHPDRTHWFEWLPESSTLYVQSNGIANDRDESMADFYARVFAAADSLPLTRMVIDLRLNGGGNNMLNNPVWLGLVRRPELDRPDRLFVVIGRNTFSAASHLVTHLERFTNATLVGEPTGGSPNHFGDARSIDLPNSGLRAGASTIYWQNSLPRPFEQRDWTPPEVAAEPTARDYAEGRDPALEAILAYRPEEPIGERLAREAETGGLEAAVSAFRRWEDDPAHAYVDVERDLNQLGYSLMDEGRTEAAVAVLFVNAQAYPESVNVWDSLGDGYAAAGDREKAIQAYERAAEMDPHGSLGASSASKADDLRRSSS